MLGFVVVVFHTAAMVQASYCSEHFHIDSGFSRQCRSGEAVVIRCAAENDVLSV